MSVEIADVEQVWREADCLFDTHAVNQALDAMSVQIRAQLAGRIPLVLPVMNGALMVASQLILRMDYVVEVDYIHATRYRGKTFGGDLHWYRKPSVPLKDRVVLVVDDLLDEGPTLAAILEYCQQQGAAEVFTAVLVDKKHDRKAVGARADFIGLEAPDRYLFGYGMDYKDYLRNVPGVYAVKGM